MRQTPKLVSVWQVHEYLREVTDAPLIVEIGCGTGAGANLITREILPKATYYAIDMQAAAIDTCLKIHGNATNPNLKCIHESGGVGNNGNFVRDPQGLKVADNSVDFVIISETHIADIEIGPEEKEIFSEIKRILKPGGLFLWGNALPTRCIIPFAQSQCWGPIIEWMRNNAAPRPPFHARIRYLYFINDYRSSCFPFEPPAWSKCTQNTVKNIQCS
jgi:ubiquinone/menaquinone biosynthesis C-methylase UbiE